MTDKKTLTMKHDGGRTKPIEFVGVNKKDAQFWIPGAGTYDFRLSNGECKQANEWFLEGEDLEYAREIAREQKIVFKESKRIPQSKKVRK